MGGAKGASFILASLISWPERKVPENRLPDMAADQLDFFPLRIFVVEDDNDTLAAIQIYLEQLGHNRFLCPMQSAGTQGNSKVELSGSHLRY
jgi:hypothetical protein